MRIVGIASYSLFLWHLPMLLLVNTYPSLNKHSGSERMLQLLLYAAPLALIISLASYLLVEKPFLVAGRSRRVPAEPAPVPAPEPLQPAPADEPALEPQPVLPATPLPALGGLALSESDGSGS
jgi:peptidoglycan/LPS O-acetylase OafA/YrhL